MELYDPAFTQQLAPLVKCVLGSGTAAEYLQAYLDRATLAHPIWDNAIIKNRLLATKFRISHVAQEAEIEKAISAHKSPTPDTHSPLSPFNSQSDLFPSGILSEAWFRKYTHDVPFAVVCAYTLDVNRESDDELALELAALRRKYLAYNVRFVAVVVSSGAGAGVQERLGHLRQVSGLANLSGFFHLELRPEALDSLESDCELLASSLLNALKTSATDYYSSIEHRVKQRYNKYYTMPRSHVKTSIELSPKILETRNEIKQAVLLQFMHPHNVESSLAVLETSYASVLELLAKNAAHLLSKSRTEHDRKVYLQWRSLLDVLAIHIVRGCFSIEEPVAALRRHKAHVAAVVRFLSQNSQPGISLWAATQTQWLAELMVLVPESILQSLHSGGASPGSSKKSQEQIEYAGGMLFADKSQITTDPVLLFKEAASQLEALRASDFHTDVLTGRISTARDVALYRIRLLELAGDHIARSDPEALVSFGILLLCEIGDSYVGLGEHEKAIAYYEKAQKRCVLPKCEGIYRLLSRKIVLAASATEKPDVLLSHVAVLSTAGNSLSAPLEKLTISGGLRIDLNSLQPFINADVSLFGVSHQDEVRVSDTVVTQIRIESVFDPDAMQVALPGSLVELQLDHIEIQHEDDKVTRLVGGGDQKSELQTASAADGEAKFDLSGFGQKPLTFHLSQAASSPGWFSAKKLEASISVKVTTGTSEVVLNKREVLVLDHQKIKHTYDQLSLASDGRLVKHRRDLKGRNPYRVLVKPYRPSLSIETNMAPQSIIVGEKLSVPVNLLFPDSPKGDIGCKSVKLLVDAIVYNDMIETKDLHAQANWNSLKDDEPMELLDAIKNNSKKQPHDVNVTIMRSPSSQLPEDTDLKVVLYFRLVVVTSASELSEYAIDQIELAILPRPFFSTLAIAPRKHEGDTPTIPNPFVYEPQSEGNAMPKIARTWLLQTFVQDSHSLLQSEQISVTKAKLSMRSSNPEIELAWADEITADKWNYGRLFTSSTTHRPTTTNVTVIASATFSYKRVSSSHENVFETDEEEIVVPLQDPRVLLQVDREGNKVHLNFTIENPTSRIFTFATTLTTDRAMGQGVTWDFDDVRNESPLERTLIPVLPFSLHNLNFHASYSIDDGTTSTIELPRLQVHDMHYKVDLPTLSLQSSVEVTESGVSMKL